MIDLTVKTCTTETEPSFQHNVILLTKKSWTKDTIFFYRNSNSLWKAKKGTRISIALARIHWDQISILDLSNANLLCVLYCCCDGNLSSRAAMKVRTSFMGKLISLWFKIFQYREILGKSFLGIILSLYITPGSVDTYITLHIGTCDWRFD